MSNDCCVAGYDVSTKKSYDDTIRSFDQTVGLKYLKGMHVNDSKCAPHLLWGHETPMGLLRLCHVAESLQQAVSMLCLAAKFGIPVWHAQSGECVVQVRPRQQEGPA